MSVKNKGDLQKAFRSVAGAVVLALSTGSALASDSQDGYSQDQVPEQTFTEMDTVWETINHEGSGLSFSASNEIIHVSALGNPYQGDPSAGMDFMFDMSTGELTVENTLHVGKKGVQEHEQVQKETYVLDFQPIPKGGTEDILPMMPIFPEDNSGETGMSFPESGSGKLRAIIFDTGKMSSGSWRAIYNHDTGTKFQIITKRDTVSVVKKDQNGNTSYATVKPEVFAKNDFRSSPEIASKPLRP